ncbi:TPA_asm: G [Phyllostachys alphacytorhabdovirus 1]|nr:TPA_asm: G [Phyllostachys alphacytorhabdovirus 1]
MGFILALCLFWLSASSTVFGLFNHSVGPLAYCGSDYIDVYKYTESCMQKCLTESPPKATGMLELFDDVNMRGGPPVTKCSKVRLTQVFTETWTLSQIKSSVKSKVLPVARDECLTVLSNKCPSHNCSILAPDELIGEYHYASDTTISQEFVELVSLPSGVDFLSDTIMVSPAHSPSSFPLKDMEGRVKEDLYLWGDTTAPSKCPFSLTRSYGCDAYGDPVHTIKCRKNGLVVTDVDKSVTLSGECSELKRSTSGLLYKWIHRAGTIDTVDKRLHLYTAASASLDLSAFKDQVANAFNVIDEDICHTQCALVNSIARQERDKEVLLRVGGQYALLSKSNYISPCKPILGCKLLVPHRYCGNPPRFGVMCQGVVYFWNPMKSHIDHMLHCQQHNYRDNLTISIGNHLYRIDDDMKIELPQRDSFGLSHDSIAISANNMEADFVSLDLIKKSWNEFKSRPQIKSEATESAIDKKTDSWSWDISSPIGYLTRIVSEIASTGNVIIFVGTTIIACMVGKWIIGSRKIAGRGGPDYHLAEIGETTTAQWI